MAITSVVRMFALSAALALPVAGIAAEMVRVGSNDSENCVPFSCLASARGAGALYQQAYASSAFPGSTWVGSVSFTATQIGRIDTARYDVSFYLSPFGPTTLTTDAALNRGALLSNFGSFALSGGAPAVLTLSGNAFTYNPSAGNLLMQVIVNDFTFSGDFSAFFQSDETGLVTSRYLKGVNDPVGNVDTGALVTTFAAPSVAAVPEPASWAMMLVGFLAIGLSLRSSPSAFRTRKFAFGF